MELSITAGAEGLNQEELTMFFLSDPKLCYIGLADDDLHVLYSERKYPISPNSGYLGIRDEGNKLMCVVKYEQFTQMAICPHFYLATSCQGKGISDRIHKLVTNYFVDKFPSIKIAIMTVPSPCTYVCKAIERFGAMYESRIKNIMVWRGEVVDLLFYRLKLKRIE